jgi:hypothetical protein
MYAAKNTKRHIEEMITGQQSPELSHQELSHQDSE